MLLQCTKSTSQHPKMKRAQDRNQPCPSSGFFAYADWLIQASFPATHEQLSGDRYPRHDLLEYGVLYCTPKHTNITDTRIAASLDTITTIENKAEKKSSLVTNWPLRRKLRVVSKVHYPLPLWCILVSTSILPPPCCYACLARLAGRHAVSAVKSSAIDNFRSKLMLGVFVLI